VQESTRNDRDFRPISVVSSLAWEVAFYFLFVIVVSC
jgi:hypothetical protein